MILSLTGMIPEESREVEKLMVWKVQSKQAYSVHFK